MTDGAPRSPEERERILAYARRAVATAVREGRADPEPPADGPEGWYADCPGGREAGCAPISGLIIPIDCSP